MAVTPEYYRAARLAFPKFPITAILGFALLGVGGSAFLAYTSFSFDEAKPLVATPNDVPVYSARAVPFDTQREDPAHRAASIARALTASQAQVRRADSLVDRKTASVSEPLLLSDSDRELNGFPGFANVAVANSFVVVSGTSFGISAQNAPSGFAAADAETLTAAPVPEPSTWLCGGALLMLVAVRGAHASWHRNQRRAANRSGSRNQS